MRSRNASASARGSSRGTSTPNLPPLRTSLKPSTSDATTGTPQAKASMAAQPKLSLRAKGKAATVNLLHLAGYARVVHLTDEGCYRGQPDGSCQLLKGFHVGAPTDDAKREAWKRCV